MHKNKIKNTNLALALLLALFATANADEVNFDGNNESDWAKVKDNPSWLWLVSPTKYYFSPLGSSSNNILKVNNVSADNSLDGRFSIFGGVSEFGKSVNNKVIIDKVEGIAVFGAYSNTEASDNSVEVQGDISATSADIMVVGGAAGNFGTVVRRNNVLIKGNVYGNVMGGLGQVRGDVSGNTVTVEGDYNYSKQSTGLGMGITGGMGLVDVNENTITLQGRVLSGRIIGGLTIYGKAINNVVNITGGNNGNNIGDIYIYGGADQLTHLKGLTPDKDLSQTPKARDIFTGNELNFSGRSLTAKTIANFEYYNFILDPQLVNTNTASITAENIVLGNRDGSVTSKVNVVGIKQGEQLKADDKFLLIKSRDMTGKGEGDVFKSVAQQGISVLYDVETTVDTNKGEAIAIILGSKVNPQLKALSEGHLADLMLLTRGADMVAYSTFDTIKEVNDGGFVPFVKMGGSHNRYDSGSRIKSNDYFIMAGVSLRNNNLTTAAFVEAGWGDYDTRNTFSDAANVDGDGDNRYVGIGVLGKYDFSNGVYVDGSLRFGKSHNKFNTSDIRNLTTGETARYSFNRNYVSAHAGVGYIHNIDATNNLDFSAKYLWTHLGSKDTVIAGDGIKFDSLDSNRLRLTAIWNHQYTESTRFKAGVGYEYEFSAKAKATALNTYSIGAPSVKGSTGIVTLGVNVNPESNKRLGIDFNINGYAGKRDGVSANIKVEYQF